MVKKILIVEDESDLIKLLKYNLEKEGFRVSYATDGSIALAEVRRDPPDLVILDLMLPGLDGLEVCRQLRRSDKFARIPVLMLSARSEEADRIVGLELGADDYVTKPFSMREVVARVRALLRRNEQAGPQKSKLQRGEIMIDPMAHSVMVSGRTVELSALEFRLLHYLASTWLRTPAWSFPAINCSTASGATTGPSRLAASTSTSAVCGKKSRTNPSSPSTFKPSMESATVLLSTATSDPETSPDSNNFEICLCFD